jgi:hypothetical protein
MAISTKGNYLQRLVTLRVVAAILCLWLESRDGSMLRVSSSPILGVDP